MKIENLKINGFGKLEDKEIEFSNGINIMWLAFPIVEAVALVVAVILMIKANKTKILTMDKFSESA